MTEKFWLGVVQREHVLRGVALGIAQVNHGSAAIKRVQPGDGFAFYSPKTSYPDGDPLREFTAIGRVADEPAWQGQDADSHPWRRRVEWDERAASAPITPLLEVLELTRGNRNWGFIMRRGLVEVTHHDFAIIAHEMGSSTLER